MDVEVEVLQLTGQRVSESGQRVVLRTGDGHVSQRSPALLPGSAGPLHTFRLALREACVPLVVELPDTQLPPLELLAARDPRWGSLAGETVTLSAAWEGEDSAGAWTAAPSFPWRCPCPSRALSSPSLFLMFSPLLLSRSLSWCSPCCSDPLLL